MAPRPSDPSSAKGYGIDKQDGNNLPLLQLGDLNMEDDELHEMHAKAIIDMSDLVSPDDKSVSDAVKFWKQLADHLKLEHYPLFSGPSNSIRYGSLLRKKAKLLDGFLDSLMTKNSVVQEATYDKLRLLIGQGETYEVFKTRMNELDFSLKCNEIWENETVAYRCNTCALTPCMSLCGNCFHRGGHESHDYTRFFSREGGACDCGNADVIKREGFCSRHGDSANRPPPPSPLIVSLPQFIIVKLYVRLFLLLRGWKERLNQMKSTSDALRSGDSPDDVITPSMFTELELHNIKPIVAFLTELVNSGGPMRESMSEILLDTDLYKNLTERTIEQSLSSKHDFVDVSLDWRTKGHFKADMGSLVNKGLLATFPTLTPTNQLSCSCLLDELIFWIIRLEFPQNLINLSLSMLSEPTYRDCFATRFFTWYPLLGASIRSMCRMARTIIARNDTIQQTCSRVVHISVQMLSSEAMCVRLMQDLDIVNKVFTTLLYLLSASSTTSKCTLDPSLIYCESVGQIEDKHSNWPVIAVEMNDVMAQHGYWFAMGDLQNLLSHSNVINTGVLLSDTFKDKYLQILTLMQGMYLTWRIIQGEHRENDVAHYVHRSYTVEFEMLAIVMFNIVTTIQHKDNAQSAIVFFDMIKEKLVSWLDAISGHEIMEPKCCPAFNITFHLPLHRHISTALTHFDQMEDFRNHVEQFRKDEVLLRKLALHPIRIQAARAEFQAGMWVRNGTQMRVQSVIYTQPHINNCFQAPDIDMIRYVAANVDPNFFIECVFQSFHMMDLFELLSDVKEEEDEEEDDDLMDTDDDFEGDVEMEEPADLDEEQDDPMLLKEMAKFDRREKAIRAKLDKRADLTVEQRNKRLIYQMSKIPGASRRILNMLKMIQANPDEVVNSPIFRPKSVRPLRFHWKGDEAAVIRREEWIDVLLSSLYRMLLEVVVLRINCGSSDEEAMRCEIVNGLASDTQTHSHLRGLVTEKGARGPEVVDSIFDKILDEVSVFCEPAANPNGTMRQGHYGLKRDVYYNEFCPLFGQMRSSSLKMTAQLLSRVEVRERQLLGIDERSPNSNVWIPYRLCSFLPEQRFASVRKVGQIFISERFIQLAIVSIRANLESIHVRDTTLQLVIYALSVGVRYAESLPLAERNEALNRLHQEYEYTDSRGKVGTQVCIFSLVFVLFKQACVKNGNAIEMMEKVLDGSLHHNRIVGGAAEYLGRLLSIICHLFPISKMFLVESLNEMKMHEVPQQPVDNTLKKAEEERKLAAKKRREALLLANQKKNSAVMKKMMEIEGMSQTEMDKLDTKQPAVRLFDCPICGESESPSTLQDPMGLLVYVTSNMIGEQCVDESEEEKTLLERDQLRSKHEPDVKHRRNWNTDRHKMAQHKMFYSELLGFPNGVELKTCGHTAHYRCYTAYCETINMYPIDNRMPEFQRDIPCCVCRYPVNAQLPISIDWGYQTSNEKLIDGEVIYETLVDCVRDWKKPLNSEDDMLYNQLYTSNIGNVMYNSYWKDEPDNQLPPLKGTTHIISLIKSNIERNVIYSMLDLPERRKCSRMLITEHLLAAVVARTGRRDVEVSLCAIRDLFPNQYLTAVPEAERVTCSDDDLITASDIRPDDLSALRSTAVRERARRQSEHVSDVISIFDHRPRELPVEAQLPILLFDAKYLLIRLAGFIVDNIKLSIDNKLCLYNVLVQRCVLAVEVKAAFCLLLRGTTMNMQRLVEQNDDEQKQFLGDYTSLANIIANHLHSEEGGLFQAALNILEEKSIVDEYSTIIRKCKQDFLMFAERLLLESGIYTKKERYSVTNVLNVQFLDWNDESIKGMIGDWLHSFNQSIQWTKMRSHRVLLTHEPLLWKPSLLLHLPNEYDSLFSRYFHRACINCNKIPMNPVVCMLCSTLICLDDCCSIAPPASVVATSIRRVSRINEMERHTEECGNGIGCFAALNSSLTIICRYKHAAIWGSVYLDSHGEEDRNLRRGKPLYLSTSRVNYLQSDWAEQEWGRLQWITASTIAGVLRDAHQLYVM